MRWREVRRRSRAGCGARVSSPESGVRKGVGLSVKRLVILGSTGSIGSSALDVVRRLSDRFRVVGISGLRNWQELAVQCREFAPERVAVPDEVSAQNLKDALGAGGPEVLGGPEALVELVRRTECDVVLSAVVGAAALPATIEAARLGRRIALANKEALVMSGALLKRVAAEHGAEIIPVDSEHSAIFQAMKSGRPGEVRRIILTGSGGPFRPMKGEDLLVATPEQALAHPTWNMGRKITIDSATMMNKALEVIEARWLFDTDPDRIEVLIHPESIVHSLVEFVDGSIVAQLGLPDMRTPIQYALTYPERVPSDRKGLDLAELGQLTFERPDRQRFPALGLGFRAARQGGTAGAALSAANEVVVHAFLGGLIRFTDIARITGEVLTEHDFVAEPTLQEILDADRRARREARRKLETAPHGR